MKREKIPILEFVLGLSDAIDLIDPQLAEHHKRVAYISLCLADKLSLSDKERTELLLAGALHDIGGVTHRERVGILATELGALQQHAELGYHLLRTFPPFRQVALIVRYHCVPWNNGHGQEQDGRIITLSSHILQLANKVAELIDSKRPILEQRQVIRDTILRQAGKVLHPEVVAVFESIEPYDYFWLNTSYTTLGVILDENAALENVPLTYKHLLSLTKLFSHLIDFRSSFTATHSSGVAAISEELGRLIGLPKWDCRMLRIAGLLHDLGKLAVPLEIIQKPAPLTEDEYNLVRIHTFYTYRILDRISAFKDIAEWASFHHERLRGSGYPFKLEEAQLSIPAKIVAVADVFTAVMENRPYRKGMTAAAALALLQNLAAEKALDRELVELVTQHFTALEQVREAAQEQATVEYQQFLEKIGLAYTETGGKHRRSVAASLGIG